MSNARQRTASHGTAASAPGAQWLGLDQQLCFALYSSSLAMTKLYKPLLQPLGLTYPQYLAMLVLWEHDAARKAAPARSAVHGIGVSELGQRLMLDSGTLTPLLKRLEAAGLVERTRDAADERRVLLRLTPAGRALRARAAKVPAAIAGASGCSLDELAVLTARLQGLRDQVASTTRSLESPGAG